MAAIDLPSRRAFVAATLGQLTAMPIVGATFQPEVPTLFADVPPRILCKKIEDLCEAHARPTFAACNVRLQAEIEDLR